MSGTGLGYEILGAVKVKDGLFIGDELAAQDLEFVVANKVTRVINCCGRQVPNHWEPIGVIYLTYFWVDADNQTVLDPRDVVSNEIFRFIEEALEGAESVLIHSVRGQSRSCCVLSAYMMKKYNWGLRKTMEFLSSRRPDLNLKPSFLQQLSGYERRLMAQSKVPFSLDWNDADFSRLESEDLLLRNTYINSQMGPLAEFHAGDLPQGKPRKLMWHDNNTDDKLRLEKPAGADKHNLQNCKRNPMGQQILKSVLKVPRYQPQRNKENQSLQSRPTAAISNENPQEAQPQAHPMASMVPGAPPTALGPSLQGPISMQQAPGQPNPAPLEARDMAPQYMHSIPTAWGESDRPVTGPGGNGMTPGLTSGYPDPSQQPAQYGYQVMSNSGVPARGPANNIRDSLCGLSRKESPDPSCRAASRDSLVQSRDPSPADHRRASASSRRDSPMAYRGESPLRLLSRSGPRGSSPAVPCGAEKSKPHTNGTGGYNPSVQLGFCLGGIRAGSSGGPPNAPSNMIPGSGAPQRGMDAFRSVRSGGPVRAKADLLGADGGNSSLRRSRPQTAPTARANSGSRPSSPLGQSNNRASGSRPSSPQTRPSSPGQSMQSKPVPVPQAAYPQIQLDKTKHRSLSSHMRRAPSPTPAFNRNPSPSRPRWRM